MITGGCLCGAVRYEIHGALGPVMGHCHCSMCRKFHGAPFGTVVNAATQDLRWAQGRDLITRYRSSPDVIRCFCRVCGSPLPDPAEPRDQVFVPAGGLDDDPGVRPVAHIFVGSKAPWYEITDDLPTFEEFPPNFGPHGPEEGEA